MDRKDPKAWALGIQKRTAATSCHTCALGKKIVDAIEVVIKMRSEGKTAASIGALYRMLRSEYEYPYTESALRGHIRRCEPVRQYWEKVTGKNNGKEVI